MDTTTPGAILGSPAMLTPTKNDATQAGVNCALDKLLASEELAKSATSRRLLSYLASRSLAGNDGPKEAEIAIDVFARDARFNGAEDSVVRVSMRALRQKLAEYYAGSGRDDPVMLDVPKGSYRLTQADRPVPAPPAPEPTAAAKTPTDGLNALRASNRRWTLAALATSLLLTVSLLANMQTWRQQQRSANPELRAVRDSTLWSGVAHSDRPVMLVLGDLFMFSQTDPLTGRTQTVRDSAINSSEDLRALLAAQPALAAERGLRYSTMLQRSAVLGMVSVLQIVGRPGRQVEVRMRDELQAADIRKYDIIYIGPISRLGALGGGYQFQSRYRFDAPRSIVKDVINGQEYASEGSLGDHHKEYALAARFPGPEGNTLMIITSGGRNAGLLEVTRMLTSSAGLRRVDQQLAKIPKGKTSGFEALLTVNGFKQTDLSADVLEIHALPQDLVPAAGPSQASSFDSGAPGGMRQASGGTATSP